MINARFLFQQPTFIAPVSRTSATSLARKHASGHLHEARASASRLSRSAQTRGLPLLQQSHSSISRRAYFRGPTPDQ